MILLISTGLKVESIITKKRENERFDKDINTVISLASCNVCSVLSISVWVILGDV
jgi:hypothetical protein